MKHLIVGLSLILTLAVPAVSIAQSTAPMGPAGGTAAPDAPAGGTTAPAGSVSASTKLENPLKGVDSLGDFFYLVINFVYSLSYAVIALFLIISGFKFVMAQGKPEALDNAKMTFKYTIIGAVLLIGANVITEVVRTVINQFVDTSI